jgi:Flp pilus assembly protein TadD
VEPVVSERNPALGGVFIGAALALVAGAAAFVQQGGGTGPAEPGAPAAAAPGGDPLGASIAESINLAIDRGRAGDVEGAAAALAELAEKHPDRADVHFNHGVALEALERWAEADAAFLRVLKLEPEDYEAIAERATIALSRGEVEAAAKLLESVPIGRGRLRERLSRHPTWIEHANHPDVARLRERHGAADRIYD